MWFFLAAVREEAAQHGGLVALVENTKRTEKLRFGSVFEITHIFRHQLTIHNQITLLIQHVSFKNNNHVKKQNKKKKKRVYEIIVI